jgi:hypothetical protein
MYVYIDKGKSIPELNKLSTTPWRCVVSAGIAAAFLNSSLGRGEWSALCFCPFTPWETYGIYWLWGWVDPRAGIDVTEESKIPCPCRESNVFRGSTGYLYVMALSCIMMTRHQHILSYFCAYFWTNLLTSVYYSFCVFMLFMLFPSRFTSLA